MDKKVKLILLSLLFLSAFAWTKCWADLSQIGNDIIDNTHLTLLSGAHPAYFYELQSGNSKNSQGGVLDHVFTYRFISADLGWVSAINGGSVGTGVGGAGVQIDKLVTFVLPQVSAYINTLIPSSAQGFWRATFFGFSGGWDFDTAQPRYFFHTGINFSWGS